MNSHQIQDIRLMYEAVYNDELREKAEEYNNQVTEEDIVEVATEYFYTYGLNSDGIDILIEKVGLDNFVEFVYSLSEDLMVLNEARSGKSRIEPVTKGGKSVGSLKGGQKTSAIKRLRKEKEARKESEASASAAKPSGLTAALKSQSVIATKEKSKKAAQERKETERKEPESKGADTEAKTEQPKSKKPIRDAIARKILAGMERHRKATQTAGNLARETKQTLGKIVSVTHEAGRRAGEHVKKHGWKSLANEEFEYWVNSLVEEGYDLSEYTWDDMYEIYLDEEVKRTSKTYDSFDIVLEHLVSEGYADTNEDAITIMANMSEEWREEILDEATRLFYKLQKEEKVVLELHEHS
jgi:hypothetical protein